MKFIFSSNNAYWLHTIKFLLLYPTIFIAFSQDSRYIQHLNRNIIYLYTFLCFLRVYFFIFKLHSRLMTRSINPFILRCMYLEAKTSWLALIGSALEKTVRE